MNNKDIYSAGLRLLQILASYAGPATCADISERVGMADKSVRERLNKLAKLGYTDAVLDGSRMRYFITDAGRARLDQEDDELDNFPRPDSSLIVRQAVMTQPTSVFDLARMMQR